MNVSLGVVNVLLGSDSRSENESIFPLQYVFTSSRLCVARGA